MVLWARRSLSCGGQARQPAGATAVPASAGPWCEILVPTSVRGCGPPVPPACGQEKVRVLQWKLPWSSGRHATEDCLVTRLSDRRTTYASVASDRALFRGNRQKRGPDAL